MLGEICEQRKLGACDVDGSQGESPNGRLDAFLSAPGPGIPQNRFLPALHLRPSNEPSRVERMNTNCLLLCSQKAAHASLERTIIAQNGFSFLRPHVGQLPAF